jgi:hypothetical protein
MSIKLRLRCFMINSAAKLKRKGFFDSLLGFFLYFDYNPSLDFLFKKVQILRTNCICINLTVDFREIGILTSLYSMRS